MYGTTETTKVIDSNNSTETTAQNIKNNEIVMPVRKRYEIRKRVSSQEQEHHEYTLFSNELSIDKAMLDPSFKIERSRSGDDKGYYYVVRCYTLLEY